MAGLVRQAAVAAGLQAAVRLRLHALRCQPVGKLRREPERDDHHVGLDHRFAARDRFRALAAVRVRRAEAGFHHAHAAGLLSVRAVDGERLAIEQELHAFLACIGDFARGAGHVGLIAAIGAGHAGRTHANRAAHAVHAGIAAAQHHHALAGKVRQRQGVFPAGNGAAGGITPGDDAAVLHQERQRRQHALQVLAGQAAIGIAVRTQAQEHRIELREQLFDADVAADLHAEAELHAHVLQHLPAGVDHRLVQLEAGNAELQQAADLLVAVEHGGGDAAAHQPVGAGQPGRAGTDHRDLLAGGDHLGQVRAPALRERGIDDVLLHRADGHRAELVVQCARAFAQAVLRAHAAAHLR